MCFFSARKAQYLYSVFNDKLYLYLAQKYKKGFVNRACIQMFKPHTHTLYILRLCTNIVYIFVFILQMKNTTTTK